MWPAAPSRNIQGSIIIQWTPRIIIVFIKTTICYSLGILEMDKLIKYGVLTYRKRQHVYSGYDSV